MSKKSAQIVIDKLTGREPPPQTVGMSIRVNPDTWTELHNLAGHLGVSVSKLVREMLDQSVNEMLDVLGNEMGVE